MPRSLTLQIPDQMLMQPVQPVWIRYPEKGETCPHTGLRHTALSYLVKSGQVESREKRITPDSKRRIRLIRLQSVLDWIEDDSETVPTAPAPSKTSKTPLGSN